MSPRIAIPVPTSRDQEYNHRSWPKYARAIECCGGEPVRIELGFPAQIREHVADCHGVLLPGSPADVRPSRYGQEVDPLTAPADLPREACDDRLLEDAERLRKPVLGVCFGLQSMNVWRGGSLIQHITPLPVHHAAGPEVAVAHSALVANDSLLGSILDSSEAQAEGAFLRLLINTSHHQAIAAPGTGLRIVARSPEDGVIEALESTAGLDEEHPQFLLGVQWHPERSFEISPSSRALFARLVAEAARFATRLPALSSR